MNLLSLTFSEFERLLKAFSVTTIALAAAIFFLRWKFFDATLFSALWQAATAGLSVSTLLFGLFARLTWKSQLLAKLLNRPIVHGVWTGSLRTNFKGADGKELQDIPIAFVIRQTYLSMSIESFTKSQEGESKLEALIRNAKTNSTRLCYVFELRRQYQGENKLTTGSGELKLMDNGSRLKGHYWTNSPTQGDLELTLVSRDCTGVDCFEVAEKKVLMASPYKE